VLKPHEVLGETFGDTPIPWFLPGDDGYANVANPAEIFYNDLPPAEAAAAVARLRPHSLRSLAEEQTATAWEKAPTTYLLTTNDQSMPVDMQMSMACGARTSTSWPRRTRPSSRTPTSSPACCEVPNRPHASRRPSADASYTYRPGARGAPGPGRRR
jgi:hypothetical protein